MKAIYKSDHIDVFYSPKSSSQVTVTFSNWTSAKPKPLWHENIKNSSSIFFVAKKNHWYQIPTMKYALRAAVEVRKNYDHAVTMGSSMGGFASIAFAGTLAADHSFSISPQYSVNKSIVAAETRWQGNAGWFKEWSNPIPTEGPPAYIFFDPVHKLDAMQASLIALNHSNAVLLPLPYSGHPCGFALSDLGMINKTIEEALTLDPMDGLVSIMRGYICNAERSASVILNQLRLKHVRTSLPQDWETSVKGSSRTIQKIKSILSE